MPARPCARWCPVGEDGRVGILVVAGCAFVCLLMVVGVALTEVAMQDRRLVACADALAGASVAGAPLSEVAVRARPSVSFVPPALGRVVVPELTRISSARVRGVSDTP